MSSSFDPVHGQFAISLHVALDGVLHHQWFSERVLPGSTVLPVYLLDPKKSACSVVSIENYSSSKTIAK